jgi:hypothetical protein
MLAWRCSDDTKIELHRRNRSSYSCRCQRKVQDSSQLLTLEQSYRPDWWMENDYRLTDESHWLTKGTFRKKQNPVSEIDAGLLLLSRRVIQGGCSLGLVIKVTALEVRRSCRNNKFVWRPEACHEPIHVSFAQRSAVDCRTGWCWCNSFVIN